MEAKKSSLSILFVFQAQLGLEGGEQSLYFPFSIKGGPVSNKGQKNSDGAPNTAGISADEGLEKHLVLLRGSNLHLTLRWRQIRTQEGGQAKESGT